MTACGRVRDRDETDVANELVSRQPRSVDRGRRDDSLCDIVRTDVVRIEGCEDGSDCKNVVVLMQSRHREVVADWRRDGAVRSQ